MDRLDRLSLAALAAIVIAVTGLLFFQKGEAPASRPAMGRQAAATVAAAPEFERKSRVASDLLAAGDFARARQLIETMVAEFPFEAGVFMLQGDLAMREDAPIRAMFAYRSAIDLNPDLLDRKTPAFQGKKIKVAVEEAKSAIEAGRQEDSVAAGNRDEQRKVLYYMQRRLKGSCG